MLVACLALITMYLFLEMKPLSWKPQASNSVADSVQSPQVLVVHPPQWERTKLPEVLYLNLVRWLVWEQYHSGCWYSRNSRRGLCLSSALSIVFKSFKHQCGLERWRLSLGLEQHQHRLFWNSWGSGTRLHIQVHEREHAHPLTCVKSDQLP